MFTFTNYRQRSSPNNNQLFQNYRLGVFGQRPVPGLHGRHVAEHVVGEPVHLPAGAGQGGKLAFIVSILHPGLICNGGFGDPAQKIVPAAAHRPQRVGGGGRKAQHFADAAAVGVAHRGAGFAVNPRQAAWGVLGAVRDSISQSSLLWIQRAIHRQRAFETSYKENLPSIRCV